MPIELYPAVAKIKRNGVYENLPGFVPETGAVATQQMIATSESSATAQYVHNKGEYFRLNDTLYQAIVKINVGDAIVVGTNCEVAVLGNDVTHIANSIAAYELGIATSSHNTGNYFMVGETMYVATANIQVGDTISTSTNCRKAVVGDELSGLKTAITPFVETVPYINLFDGNFDESGYFDSTGNKASANFKRTSKYYPIIGKNLGLIYGYTSEIVNSFAIGIYDENYNFIPTYGTFLNELQTGSKGIPQNAKYFRLYTRAEYAGNSTIALTPVNAYVPYQLVPQLKDEIIKSNNLSAELQELLDVTDKRAMSVTGIDGNVLVNLYVPNLEAGWTVYRVNAKSDSFRFAITDKDGNTTIDGFDGCGTDYSDVVQTLVDSSGDIIAYYVLHYTGTDYVTTTTGYVPDTAKTSSLDANPIIKEYLNREENLVLIGDSIFGYETINLLAPLIQKISKKRIFNCGFGGCTMAIRNNNYDVFSFTKIADSIVSGDFSDQLAQIGLVNIYKYRYADLVSVDWTKPTTIFIDYVNNDFSSNIPIGDVWQYTDETWDKTTLLGALNYGAKTILTEYPHIKIVFFTGKWRCLNESGVLVPPYAHQNTLNKTILDYNEGIIETCGRMGVSVYDFFNYGPANFYNKEYIMINGASHFTLKGYERVAILINNLDNSFIG